MRQDVASQRLHKRVRITYPCLNILLRLEQPTDLGRAQLLPHSLVSTPAAMRNSTSTNPADPLRSEPTVFGKILFHRVQPPRNY